jgi:hypothetical protein
MLVFRHVVVHTPPYRVRVSLHDDQLPRDTHVAFDRVMNPIFRNCIELHPQEGRFKPLSTLEPSVYPIPIAPHSLPPSLPVMGRLYLSPQ